LPFFVGASADFRLSSHGFETVFIANKPIKGSCLREALRREGRDKLVGIWRATRIAASARSVGERGE
jgi:hypothetical protein